MTYLSSYELSLFTLPLYVFYLLVLVLVRTIPSWYFLCDGTVMSRYLLSDGTVPSQYVLCDGTEPSRYFLQDGTVPSPYHYHLFFAILRHLGKFPIGSYLKVKDSTKSSVTFLVLVTGKFSLYHLKAYVCGFILSSDV